MKTLLAPLLALCIAGAARADSVQQAKVQAPLTLTLQGNHAVQSDQGFRDVIEVSGRRSALSVVASDALYGGLAGLAIGAGVALINSDFNHGGNWGRDLALGAGIGLVAGGIFGAVDVATSSDRYMSETTRGDRKRGFDNVAGLRSAF